ncbi:MAG TPA: PEP-CTERM sorting domain-containing protein, partial [Gammaproteobacteria bacterium]|nr:PEP-CTERM sorting domain-containing protein [Gammaproteobacteria bacterium]
VFKINYCAGTVHAWYLQRGIGCKRNPGKQYNVQPWDPRRTIMQKLIMTLSLLLVSAASWAGTAPVPTPVPEPATWALIGIGVAGMLLARKRK